MIAILVVAAAAAGFLAGVGWQHATGQPARVAGKPSASRAPVTAAASAGASPAASARGSTEPSPGDSIGASPVPSSPAAPGASPAGAGGSGAPATQAYVAPSLDAPLVNLDSALAASAGSTTLDWLYQSSRKPPVILAPPGAPITDWRLASPDPGAVRGYAGDVSVVPGGRLDLHLSGTDATTRIDVYRMGLRDAHHVMTARHVPLIDLADASPDPETGRVEDAWPVSYSIAVGSSWRPGVYIAKLTGDSGGQSYVLFVVRSPRPTSLMLVLPVLTYQAYNHVGGADLYGWDGGSHARGYEVSFDRPYGDQYGAGLFFWLDFPLVAWLEDHGYNVGYLTDLDVARNPQIVEQVDTLVFSGHSEYWTGGMRDIVGGQSARGASLLFFGANQAYWQVRLGPDTQGTADRTMICYKDATLDPIAAASPTSVTSRFDDRAVNRPPRDLIGTDYAGIAHGLTPLVLAPGLLTFAPDVGLQPGQSVDGLVAGEVDAAPPGFAGVLLGSTPVTVAPDATRATATASLWINRSGGRVFDAGTFGWAWGLDPRYAAGQPSFPTAAFEQLTARIFAWAGAQPDPRIVSRLGSGTP